MQWWIGATVIGLLVAIGGIIAWRVLTERKGLKKVQARAEPMRSLMEGDEGEGSTDESIFRAVNQETMTGRVWTRIGASYPLVSARSGITVLLGGFVAGSATGLAIAWMLRFEMNHWVQGAGVITGVVVAYVMLRRAQKIEEERFRREFPEVIDQMMRLGQTGVPPLEAIGTIAGECPVPIRPVFESIRDNMLAGLDADVTLRSTSEHVRLAEFMMFASIVRLQRRAGGGITESFKNLAETLRERRRIGNKAKSATAQTQLTLIVLGVMPMVVLGVQSVVAPKSVAMLFQSEDGILVLRIGVVLIVLGIVVARWMNKRVKT